MLEPAGVCVYSYIRVCGLQLGHECGVNLPSQQTYILAPPTFHVRMRNIKQLVCTVKLYFIHRLDPLGQISKNVSGEYRDSAGVLAFSFSLIVLTDAFSSLRFTCSTSR